MRKRMGAVLGVGPRLRVRSCPGCERAVDSGTLRQLVVGIMSTRLFARAVCAALCLLAAAPVSAVATSHNREPGPDVAVQWNQATLDLLATPGVQPITVHPTRTLALVAIA